MRKLESVNVGRREIVTGPQFESESGIIKRPVSGPVAVGPLGLEPDVIVHTRFHGGEDQAVYVYRSEDYEWWSEKLERTLEPGLSGENLTLAGLPSTSPNIGSRIRFAVVELEVTAPRIPCGIFSARMGDPDIVRRFVEAERPGMYCRVIAPGAIEAGETFDYREAGSGVSVVDLFRAHYQKPGVEDIRRFLSAPVDHRTRAKLERRLRELDPSAT